MENKIIIIKDLGMKYPLPTSKQKKRYMLVKCYKCESVFEMTANNIKTRQRTTCRECSFSWGHSKYKTRIYTIWQAMKQRCYNAKSDSFNNYGGRGISVCEEWKKDFLIFYKWSVLNGYSDELTIDRINNDGNYEPNNCRWATPSQQNVNSRLIRANNTTGYRGVCFDSTRNKYVAHIQEDKKVHFLGYFDSKIDAAISYNDFIIKNKTTHPLNKI